MKIIPTWFPVGHEIGEDNFGRGTCAKDIFGLATYDRIVSGHDACIRVIVADLRSVPNVSIILFVNLDKNYDQRSRDNFVINFDGSIGRSLTYNRYLTYEFNM